MRIGSIGALAALLLLSVSGQAAARPFTARDMATMERLSSPRLSPDGHTAAFAVRATDWEANRGVSSVWTIDVATPGAAPLRLAISDKEASAPHWSPDGRALYFLSNRAEHRMQVWRTTPDGAAATQVTFSQIDVGAFKVTPDGRTLVLSMAAFADCDTLACSADRMKARAADKAEGKVFDKLSVRFWDSLLDGRRNLLFAQPLTAEGVAVGAPVPLMHGLEADVPSKPEGDETSFVVTPDSRRVVFSAHDPKTSQGVDTKSMIYIAPIDGSAPPHLLTAAGPGSEQIPAVSPDGKWLAYLTSKTSDFGAARVAIFVRPLDGGPAHEVDPGFDRSVGRIQWSEDGAHIYASAEVDGDGKLFLFDAAGGKPTALTGAGHAGDFEVGPGGVLYSRDALDGPAQLYWLATGGQPRQLTHLDAAVLTEAPMSPFEPFTFTGWNGERVHGYVVKPTGYQPGRKYPVAFLIHGGPHGSFGDTWSYRWNPQVWSGLGYAVVMVDFHGSSGYGEAFAQSIGHWGDRPLEDLQKGWAAALARYSWLDGSRACALGGSYGGYMVDWIAGAWNGPWKCLVDHDGILDTRLMAYATDIPGFSEAETGGFGWLHPEAVEQFNPINYVKNWTKPILVIHSGHDYRVPFDQGLGAFTAAQRKGVPSEFLYFDSENHWVLKPQNSVRWYAVVGAWMQRWIGDTGPK